MKHRHIKLRMYSLVLLVVLFCIGCATIMTTVIDPVANRSDSLLPGKVKEWREISWVYGGTRFDYKCFWHPEVRETNNMELFCLVDLPLSMIADTVFLPVTIPLQIFNKKNEDGIARNYYSTYKDAAHASASKTGWLPSFVPQTASNIVIAHNFDTGRHFISFRVDSDSIRSTTQNMEAISLDNLKNREATDWWPVWPNFQYITENISQYQCCSRTCTLGICSCMVFQPIDSLETNVKVWTCD